MRQCHPKHCALIVTDNKSRQLNRAVALKHAAFQRVGNRNMTFPAIVEYPFVTCSELSNAVQLACSRSGTGEKPATRARCATSCKRFGKLRERSPNHVPEDVLTAGRGKE